MRGEGAGSFRLRLRQLSCSFSAMRRIKTHLRASMSDSRMSSMAIIAVELRGELINNPAKVIDIFATLGSGKRRLDLLF